jgi:uncharacterized damage-inducible protein DinB
MPDDASTILELVRYEHWCNRQALTFMASLSHEERHRDLGFGLRTPHHTMFHIVNVMRTWSRCVGPVIAQPEPLPYSPDMTLEAMRDFLETTATSWLEAASASHEQGVLGAQRRLHQLFHIVTHGTHHRGQLLGMATLMGYEQPFEGGDFGGWSNTD